MQEKDLAGDYFEKRQPLQQFLHLSRGSGWTSRDCLHNNATPINVRGSRTIARRHLVIVDIGEHLNEVAQKSAPVSLYQISAFCSYLGFSVYEHYRNFLWSRACTNRERKLTGFGNTARHSNLRR